MTFAILRPLTLAFTTSLLLATGCAGDGTFQDTDTATDGESDTEVEFRDTWVCTDCGNNDPEVNGNPVPDFDATGATANAGGLKFYQLKNGSGVVHTLGALGDEPIAKSGGTMVAGGNQLVGWDLVFRDASLNSHTVRIMAYNHVTSWKTGGTTMPVFALAYWDAAANYWKNICPEFVNNPYATAATVLYGERYDNDLKEVDSSTAAATWFTLACSDQAAYKMKRMGYGPHGNHLNGAAATPDQRQATIKMITADYCGTGKSFTASGTAMHWLNWVGNVDTDDIDAAPEAFWTRDGAVCLGTPRRYLDTGIEEAIADECDLPTCGRFQFPIAHTYEWMTRANLIP